MHHEIVPKAIEKASIRIACSHIKENNNKLKLEKEYIQQKMDLVCLN